MDPYIVIQGIQSEPYRFRMTPNVIRPAITEMIAINMFCIVFFLAQTSKIRISCMWEIRTTANPS